jgi:predicted nuclease of predicted toxin-antitoxin system
MTVKLYADENVPRALVDALRELGQDVLTCYEAGNAGRGVADEQVLRFASSQGRAVLTMNRRDFFRLDRRIREHAGIVACTEDADCEQQAARIREALRGVDDLCGKVLRVNRPG